MGRSIYLLLICKTSGGIFTWWRQVMKRCYSAWLWGAHNATPAPVSHVYVSCFPHNKKVCPHQTRETWDWSFSAHHGDLWRGSCSCAVPGRATLSAGGNLSLLWVWSDIIFSDVVTLGPCIFFPCVWGSSVCSLWASWRASHIVSTLERSLGQQGHLNLPVSVRLLIPPSSCIKPLKSCGKQYRGTPLKAFGMSLLWQRPWK